MTGPEPASGILESSVLGPIGIQLNSQLVKSWINLRPCGLSPNNLKSEIGHLSLFGQPAVSHAIPTFAPIRILTSSWRSATPDKNVRRIQPPWLFDATMAVWCHHGCSTSWLFDATMTTHKKCFWFSAAASVARLGPQTTVSCQLKKVLNYILFLIDVIITGIVIQCHCHGTFTNKSKRSWIVSCFLTVCF